MGLYLLLGAACAVAAVGLYMYRPSLVMIPAVPASFLVGRLGGTGSDNNISFSDAFLALATVFALLHFDWRRAVRLRGLMALVAFYLTTELFSVADHPNKHDVFEWFHELLLVGGALTVGYAIAQRHRARVALGSFVAAATVLAAWTVGIFVAHGLHGGAPLPFDLQKNLLGDLFSVAVLITQYNPPWARLPERLAAVSKFVCVGGVIAVQSRQAMIALIVAVVVTQVREWRLGMRTAPRRRTLMLVTALGAVAAVAYTTIVGEAATHSQYDSLSQREVWYAQSLHLWSQYPFFGVGERFWYSNLYGLTFQPPNAEISQLATGGIVGLMGLLVLMIGGLRVAWRLPAAAGSLSFAVLLAHVVEGQFDIFWVSASGSLPWIIVGMSLAAASEVDAVGAHVPYLIGPGRRRAPVPA